MTSFAEFFARVKDVSDVALDGFAMYAIPDGPPITRKYSNEVLFPSFTVCDMPIIRLSVAGAQRSVVVLPRLSVVSQQPDIHESDLTVVSVV